MPSKKTIQVILFEGDLDLFKLRLEDHEKVDYFLIAESIYDKNLMEKNYFFNQIDEFSSLSNKIIYFNFNHSIPKTIDSWDEDFYNQIPNYLKDVCTNFEDVIFISRENEFVDYSRIFEIRNSLVSGPIILKHLQLWWGKNYVEKDSKFGTISLLFSHVLSAKKNLESLYKEKNNDASFMFSNFMDCGWSLNGIYKKFLGSERFMNELLPYNNFVSRLEKYICLTPPKFFDELKDFEAKTNPKKIKIIVEEELEIFKYFVSVKSPLFEESEIKELNKPRFSLYGDLSYEHFLQKFKLNECFKLIKKYSLTNHDVIQIISDGKSFDLESSSLDSKILSEIINPS